MPDPVLYPASHLVTVHMRGGGGYSSSYPTPAEAFAAADASNIEYGRQPGDYEWAYVTTEYSRDDGIPGALWRWRIKLTPDGDLAITEHGGIRSAFRRVGDSLEPDRDDMNPTIQVWHANDLTAADRIAYYEISVVAATRAGALADARQIIAATDVRDLADGEWKAVKDAVARGRGTFTVPEGMKPAGDPEEFRAAIEELGGAVLTDVNGNPHAILPDIGAGGADAEIIAAARERERNETTPAATFADMNTEFPRTPRGYPYEGPAQTPGSSNADLPCPGSPAPLASYVDADMTALEERLTELEQRHSRLITSLAKAESIAANLYPWERAGQLARDMVTLIEDARRTDDDVPLEAFMAAFVGDDRIHQSAAPALADVIATIIPAIVQAMDAEDERQANAVGEDMAAAESEERTDNAED